MVLNENECSNALKNANHKELHVSTLMGFCYNSQPSSAVQPVMLALYAPKNLPLSRLSCKMTLSAQEVLWINAKLTCALVPPELKNKTIR